MSSPSRQDLVDLLLAERYGPRWLPALPTPLRPELVSVPDEPAVTERRRRRLCEAIDGRFLLAIPDLPPRREAA